MGVSKTQIDRLGDRLKAGQIANVDLQLLDEYRRSFSDAHDVVVSTIRDRLGLQPTGRPAKSTPAIVDKLHRESVRLSQIQDIAGCRLIVWDLVQQDAVVDSLRAEFSQAHVIDRRANPSHGYRAVHIVVELRGRAVEIRGSHVVAAQVGRISEKCADAFGPAIKYGGGDEALRGLLSDMSVAVSQVEKLEVNPLATSPSPSIEAQHLAQLLENGRAVLLFTFERGIGIAVKALEGKHK